jgi:hypothetical protein
VKHRTPFEAAQRQHRKPLTERDQAVLDHLGATPVRPRDPGGWVRT